MSYELAQCVQRYHVGQLATKVKKNAEAMRLLYDTMKKKSERYPKQRGDMPMLNLEDQPIDEYINTCNKFIKDYESSTNNVVLCNVVDNNVDAAFPLEYYNSLRILALGFAVYGDYTEYPRGRDIYEIHLGNFYKVWMDEDTPLCASYNNPARGVYDIFFQSYRNCEPEEEDDWDLLMSNRIMKKLNDIMYGPARPPY